MKKLLSLLPVFLIAFSSTFSQTFPNNTTQANAATKTTFPGAVNTALQNRYFTDTAVANAVPYLKFTPHIQIKVGESIYVRNTAATAWLLQANITDIDSVININNYNYFGSCQSRVISGSVTIDSLFAGRTTDITFQMATCSTYTVPATTFNITGSGAADRYTIIVADTLLNIFTIDGLTNPADIPNIVDDASQILLATYFIPAGSTTPQDVSSLYVYREGDQNFLNLRRTVTTGFDSAYTVNPFAGIYSLRIPSMVAGQYFEWQDGSVHSASNYTFFSAHLRKAGALPAGTKWAITFYNGNSLATSNAAVITNGSYGYNRMDSGSYKSIAIPFSAWSFINSQFDKIRVTFIGNTSVSTQWDDVKLQAGGANTNQGNYVQSVNNQFGTNLNIRVLDSTYLSPDSSRQIFINTYTGDTISAQTFVNYIYFDTCFTKTTVGKNTYVTFNQNCGGSGGTGTGTDSLAYHTMVQGAGNYVLFPKLLTGSVPDTFYITGSTGGSGGSPNLNVGAGYRVAVSGTNNIKTLFDGYGILTDSTTNTNGLTRKIDTSVISSKPYTDTLAALKLNKSDSTGNTGFTTNYQNGFNFDSLDVITGGVRYHHVNGTIDTILFTNNAIDSIKISNDTLYGRINATWIFQGKFSTGSVSSFSSGNLSPLFTTSVATATSTPSLTYSLTNAAAHTFFGNFTGSTGAPSYSNPSLASADFANQGTTTTVLHGNASGNPSFGAVNQTTDITGVTPLANGGTNSTDYRTATETFSNKRWVARVGSTTSSATPTINTDNVDIYKLTAQAADITSFTTNLSGTPNDGDILEIQITGTAARAITWGSSFVSSTITLPTTTVTTATLTVIFQYFTTSSYGNNKWVMAKTF